MSDCFMGSLRVRLDPSCKICFHLGTGLFAHKDVLLKNKRQQILHCRIHGLYRVPALDPLYNDHEEDNWWKYNEIKHKF